MKKYSIESWGHGQVRDTKGQEMRLKGFMKKSIYRHEAAAAAPSIYEWAAAFTGYEYKPLFLVQSIKQRLVVCCHMFVLPSFGVIEKFGYLLLFRLGHTLFDIIHRIVKYSVML